MFNIKTFIKRPHVKIDNLNKVIKNDIEIKRINHDLDFDYIDGTIIIEYYDHLIMDFSLWDLVDQLWCYFIQLLEEVLQTGYGMTYFPEQPIKMEMKFVSNDLLL